MGKTFEQAKKRIDEKAWTYDQEQKIDAVREELKQEKNNGK